MKRDIAKRLMEACLKCHAAIDEAEAAALEIEDSAEQREVRRRLLQAGGQLYTDVMMDIISQFPDLDPDPRG